MKTMFARVRFLTAATVFGLTAVGFVSQGSATGLDLGGSVGGTVGGTSAHGHASARQSGANVGTRISIGKNINAKTNVLLYKKMFNADAKVYLGKNGKSTKISAKSLSIQGKAKLTLDRGGKFAKVAANVGSHHSKAKVFVGLGHSAKNKTAALIGPTHTKLSIGGKVNTGNAGADFSARVKIGMNIVSPGLGGSRPRDNRSTPEAIASRLDDLSTSDQRKLLIKCSAILAAPSKYNSDTVSLCQILTL